MSDEARRKKQRTAVATGDPEDEATAVRDTLRVTPNGVEALVGERQYVESGTLNYLGTLIRVERDPMGRIECLVFSGLDRVGDWDENGPEARYVQRFEGEQRIAWQFVCHIGPPPKHWK